MASTTRRALARRLLAPAAAAFAAGTAAARPSRTVQPISRELHVISRATFGRTPAVLNEMITMGWKNWLESQLDPASIDDSQMEAGLAAMVAGGPNARAQRELVYRSLYSRRQLQCRMVWFLNNHFNTDLSKTQGISEILENAKFAKSAFGTFHEALLASAKSPAMIEYLDNRSNVAASPNENYARELFELHTLGVFGGYSESDIAEAARVFTGWSLRFTYDAPGTPPSGAVFRFRPQVHDTGPKSLTGLGFSTPGFAGPNGVREGEALLAFLASHPSTIDFVVSKLCRYFVADDPPAGLVSRAKAMFAVRGHLGDTVRTIFTDPEFYDPTINREKTQDAFELALAVARRLQIQTGNVRGLVDEIARMGQPVHREPDPTGTPEEGPSWDGPSHVLPRWSFVERLTHGQVPTAPVSWATVLGGNPLPTTATGWVDRMLDRLVDGDVPSSTRTTLIGFLANRFASLPANPSYAQALPHLRDLTGLILRLPEAQVN